jgi:hypothetical protein
MKNAPLAGLRREDEHEHRDAEHAEQQDHLSDGYGHFQASRITSSSTMLTTRSLWVAARTLREGGGGAR